MRFKTLTAPLLLGVIFMAAAIPAVYGISPDTLLGASALVATSTIFVQYGVSTKRQAFGQLGEVGEGASVDLKQEYTRVAAELSAINDQLKAHAESAKAELEQHKALSAKTRESVDELLIQQGEMQGRLQAAEQAIVDRSTGAAGAAEQPRTLGQIVVNSEGYENEARQLQAGRGSFSVPVQAAIVSTQSDSSDGYPVRTDRVAGIVAPPNRRMTIRGLLAQGTTESNAVEYVRETGFTNSADVVAENPASEKPESDINFELDSEAVTTIAHFVPASKQILADSGMMQAYIDSRLRYGLMLKEEQQLLFGSGAGVNLHGIYEQATAYSNPGVSVTNQTNIDTLRIAMLQVTLAEYEADGIVLNPIDWTEIELTKDSDNRYIFARPQETAGPAMWGRPVVPTQAMVQGSFLTGAWSLGAQIWDREDATVVISTEDKDNFRKNMVTVLAEERLTLTVYRPEAFVKGDFDSAT